MTTQEAAFPGVEIWRGGVNTWDCDEMGHMNVRFYVSRAMEGLAGLAAELGLPHAFSPYANATLVVREQHIRFLREAHAGAALHMLGGVIEISDTEARLRCRARILRAERGSTCRVGDAERLARRYPRVTVETVAGSSHFLPMERPDLAREAIFEMAT